MSVESHQIPAVNADGRKGCVITARVGLVSLGTHWLLNSVKDLSPGFLKAQEWCCLTPPEGLSCQGADRDPWVPAALSWYVLHCPKTPWDWLGTERTELG